MFRVLCLHGFGTSAEFMRYQLRASEWESKFRDIVSFYPIDGHRASQSDPDAERILPGKYYAWFDVQRREDGTRAYVGWKHSFSYVRECIQQNGPFDGILGFSQGACLASLILGFQERELWFTDCPLFKFAILIGGFPSRDPDHKKAYEKPIECRSLHVYGEQEQSKAISQVLSEKFASPEVLVHPRGHLIPRLEDHSQQTVANFLNSNTDVSSKL